MDFSNLNILVVDNGGQWTHREYRVIRELGAKVSMVPNTSPVSLILQADGIVLSGGAPSVSTQRERLGLLSDYLDAFEGPVLGICVGHHFIAEHFGGKTGRGTTGEYGKSVIQVCRAERILAGLPERFIAWSSHSDEVKVMPPHFKLLARSEECAVEAMMSEDRPIFGLQFHPEVNDTEHGRDILASFLQEVASWK